MQQLHKEEHSRRDKNEKSLIEIVQGVTEIKLQQEKIELKGRDKRVQNTREERDAILS